MRLQKAYETFGKQADFYWVYIREAHPLGSSRPSPLQIEQPKTFERRQEVAITCSVDLKLTIPMLVDDIGDTVSRAFDAMPDRMYIIGKDGATSGRPDRGLEIGALAPKVSAEFMTQKGSLDFSKITHLSVVIFGSYT